ncbi:MAG: ABC transporter ATP-binding protein [Victivallaceae bacterium]|jgi:ABC-2 type transport system ATP-binding protein
MSENSNAIVARGVRKAYVRKKEVVKGLDLTVKRGAVYALLGCNGVGKTTSIRMITGQLTPDAGEISVLGLDPVKDAVKLRRKMAYVAEGQKLYDWMNIDDLIRFVKSFYPEWDDKICAHLLKMFELPQGVKLKDYSRGMYTKAALLAALCRDPDLLILDDPMLGLDTAARREFMRGVVDAIHEFERTVIFSTHIIPEIEALSDYAGIMVDGRLVLEAPVDEIKSSFREIRLPADAENIPSLPNIVSIRDTGEDKIIIVKGVESEMTAALHQAGLRFFTVNAMPLEDIFLAVTAKTKSPEPDGVSKITD